MADDLVQQIAEVLKEHLYTATPSHVHPYLLRCLCGVDVKGLSGFADHQAELLASRLNLHEERREDLKEIPEGLDIVVESRTGTSCRGWCNQCDFGTNGYVSPREAWDWAYQHADEKHGYKPTAQTRWVSDWAPNRLSVHGEQ